ncbi:hypothetical protein ACFQAV_03865 [Companilactobacillus huachuanensis]|uniref:MerR family transcriptional regulator n=1 Tax=Companilactobacillus huachuanensis TaxID=2559914 RepID=A0ABW1RIQ7_9LACO|nr:hypothetical protein [Companilactobacillus huachuanensis]
MNKNDLQARYQITQQVLDDFHTWQLHTCNIRNDVYFQKDLPILQTITQLRIIGFNLFEIEEYLNSNQSKQKIQLLNKKRSERLTIIHNFEKQITSIDYLKFQINKGDF